MKQVSNKPNAGAWHQGSISSGTMLPEDLIPCFARELEELARQPGVVSAQRRKEHIELVRAIEARIYDEREFENIELGIEGKASDDLESLYDMLNEYAAPYWYFGAHPGDGADYGWWLSDDWDEDFVRVKSDSLHRRAEAPSAIIVADWNDVPKWYRGEVAEVNDHGNVTYGVMTARGFREIWSVV